MKKLWISLSVMAAAIAAAIITVVVVANRKTELSIVSYDEMSHLDLGKYAVKDYRRDGINGDTTYLSFTVKSEHDFYNDVIRKSACYEEDLDYDVSGYFAFGFLSDHNHFYQYTIQEKKVRITEMGGVYTDDSKVQQEDEYRDLLSYYICFPIEGPLYAKSLDEKITGESLYDYSTSLSDTYITYQMLLDMLGHMDPDLYKLDEDSFSVKGLPVDQDESVSPSYVLTFCNTGDKVRVKRYGQ